MQPSPNITLPLISALTQKMFCCGLARADEEPALADMLPARADICPEGRAYWDEPGRAELKASL